MGLREVLEDEQQEYISSKNETVAASKNKIIACCDGRRCGFSDNGGYAAGCFSLATLEDDPSPWFQNLLNRSHKLLRAPKVFYEGGGWWLEW